MSSTTPNHSVHTHRQGAKHFLIAAFAISNLSIWLFSLVSLLYKQLYLSQQDFRTELFCGSKLPWLGKLSTALSRSTSIVNWYFKNWNRDVLLWRNVLVTKEIKPSQFFYSHSPLHERKSYHSKVEIMISWLHFMWNVKTQSIIFKNVKFFFSWSLRTQSMSIFNI